jgi:hypothetical protein
MPGMAISEKTVSVPDFWSAASELGSHRGRGLVLLPDDVREFDGQLTASFREAAQNLAIRARGEGVDVEFVAPPGAVRGMYREHAAVWVLPWILSMSTSIVVGLIVNEIQRRLDAARAVGKAPPAITFREVVIEDDRVTARELTAPADEVRDLLARRADGDLVSSSE